MSQNVAMIHKNFKNQAIMWLVMTVFMSILLLVIWLMSSAPTSAHEETPIEVSTQDFALPNSIETFNQFTKEVPPLDFSIVVRDMRHYPTEFKDKRYFEKSKNRWTIQVMDVAQNDIITEYLNGREDREKFAYFRYKNSNNELRYLLTYGMMSSAKEALSNIQVIDFGLPRSVKPKPEEVKRYLDIIDNYERGEEIVDLSSESPRAITLQETQREIPAVATKEVKEKIDQSNQKKEPASSSETPKPKAQETTTEKTPQTDKVEDKSVKDDLPTAEVKPTEAKPKAPPKTNTQMEPLVYGTLPQSEVKFQAKPEAERQKPQPAEDKTSYTPNVNTSSTPGSHFRD